MTPDAVVMRRTERLATGAVRFVERRIGWLPGRVVLVLEGRGVVVVERALAVERLRNAEYFTTADALEQLDEAIFAASMAIVVLFTNGDAAFGILFPRPAGAA